MKLMNLQFLQCSWRGRHLVPVTVVCLCTAMPVLAATQPEAAALSNQLGTAWDQLWAWVAAEFEQTPAIILGVALALTIPPLAVLGLFFRGRVSRPERPLAPTHRSIPISGFNATRSVDRCK